MGVGRRTSPILKWTAVILIILLVGEIVLRLPAGRLEHLRRAGLVLRFAAIDAAEHHRTVTRSVSLGR